MSQDDRHPFDPDRFLGGFTEERHEHQVDPDSPLGRAIAEYRDRLAAGDVETIDLETL